jgi:Tfp pilus assembly protein PilF
MSLVVEDFINDPTYNEKKEKYKRLNSQGITAYKAGKLEEALEFFKEALRKVPTNTNAMLNKIQVLLDICEHEIVEKGKNNRKVLTLIDEISQSIQGIDGLMLTEAQTERTKLLREVLDKIKTGKSK